MSQLKEQGDGTFKVPGQAFENEDFRKRSERVDVSPAGTEGCLWDDDYWLFNSEE